ncbi:MAG: Ribonuclease VapC2 [Turneriella sp.]|nr:Ribonuclease VapC2 [Turneriella sp.]
MIFLDSDICIHFLNGRDADLIKRFQAHSPTDIKIASIVHAELLFGVANSKKIRENGSRLTKFLEPYDIVPFDSRAASIYAQIRFDLSKEGNLIGPNDLILAATVLGNQGTLVTRNVGEFRRLKNLNIEIW